MLAPGLLTTWPRVPSSFQSSCSVAVAEPAVTVRLVYTCQGFLSEQWTFQPNGTITVANGWCLDNTSSGTADGNLIQLHACNGSGAQEWSHPDTGAIYNPQTGKCIQASTTLGDQLQLYTCDHDADQTWIYPGTYNH